MAKINHFLASYSDVISEIDISFEGTEINPPKAVIKRFVRIFKDISDARVQAMIDYPLVEIILITSSVSLPPPVEPSPISFADMIL